MEGATSVLQDMLYYIQVGRQFLWAQLSAWLLFHAVFSMFNGVCWCALRADKSNSSRRFCPTVVSLVLTNDSQTKMTETPVLFTFSLN